MSDVAPQTSLTIRPLAEGDSIEALTALLHRAYAGLAALGFNYTAVDQTAKVIRSRIRDGQCFVAELDGTIVGTIMFYPPGKGGGCRWYNNPEVAKIGQFGVEPHLQGRGLEPACWTMSRQKPSESASVNSPSIPPKERPTLWLGTSGVATALSNMCSGGGKSTAV